MRNSLWHDAAVSGVSLRHLGYAVHTATAMVKILRHIVCQPSLGHFDMQGWTPLHCAAQGGSAEMVDLLLSSGANARAQDVEV